MATSELEADPFRNILTTVHEAIRKSQLVKELHEKLASLPPGDFSFVTEFGRLRDVVAPQIGDTRILFPEFTPHDESLHVVKLFQIADKIFTTAYRQLNANELFLLACASTRMIGEWRWVNTRRSSFVMVGQTNTYARRSLHCPTKETD